MSGVTHHPCGVRVQIVGINESNRGRSCEAHSSAQIIALDTVLRLRKVQILNDTNTGETAIAAYWVTDGVDRCCVGFLPRHCVLQANNFDGRLVQVVTIMCANSENPRHSRQFARWNRAACHDAADITTTILSGSTAGTVGSNGQVHSTQERINYIASIASSVFEERDDDYSEETETKLNVVEHSSPNSNVKKAAITNQKC